MVRGSLTREVYESKSWKNGLTNFATGRLGEDVSQLILTSCIAWEDHLLFYCLSHLVTVHFYVFCPLMED